ncbi:MAG: hypothetical protein V4695_10735 [Pseudomonadota bacterium]
MPKISYLKKLLIILSFFISNQVLAYAGTTTGFIQEAQVLADSSGFFMRIIMKDGPNFCNGQKTAEIRHSNFAYAKISDFIINAEINKSKIIVNTNITSSGTCNIEEVKYSSF